MMFAILDAFPGFYPLVSNDAFGTEYLLRLFTDCKYLLNALSIAFRAHRTVAYISMNMVLIMVFQA